MEVVIGPERIKIKGVLDWVIPKKVKNIQKFLRLANYYKWFIKDFASIAKPLYNLVKKKSEVGLDREVEKSV